jgi:hypothetical protein
LPEPLLFPHVWSRQLQVLVNCSDIVVNAAVNIELCHSVMGKPLTFSEVLNSWQQATK